VSNLESHICRVCGYNAGESLWENGDPNWIICDCCGAESGYHDFTKDSASSNRMKWINDGCNWFSPEKKPANWDLQQQLSNIPAQWK